MMKFGVDVAGWMQVAVENIMLQNSTLQPEKSSASRVFISYPGSEEGFLYAPMLQQMLEMEQIPVWRDRTGLTSADSNRRLIPSSSSPSSATNTTSIFWNLWNSQVLVCVCTFAALQKKWPMAELLCGMARGKSVVYDCMPGHVWIASANEHCGRNSLSSSPVNGPPSPRRDSPRPLDDWVHDVKSLLVMDLQTLACQGQNGA